MVYGITEGAYEIAIKIKVKMHISCKFRSRVVAHQQVPIIVRALTFLKEFLCLRAVLEKENNVVLHTNTNHVHRRLDESVAHCDSCTTTV